MKKSKLLFQKGFFILVLIAAVIVGACHPLPQNAEHPSALSFHTQEQLSYLNGPFENIGDNADGEKELSRPLPIRLDLSHLSDGFVSVDFSEKSDFCDSFNVKIVDNTAEIFNVKADTIYYYRPKRQDGTTGEVSSFRTENRLPRNLFIDGITNARDLGGYLTENGRIKQGMIYRTAKPNKNKTETPTPLITENGIKTMIDVLKIKTEIDLRKISNNEIGALTESVLGQNVSYVNCPMVSDENMLNGNNDSLKKLFSVLADENNYPLFYHCSIGTDRTGYVSFLLLSLLGAAEEDIYRDYLFSNFGLIGSSRGAERLLPFTLYLNLQKGTTRSEKAKNILVNIGVTEQQIENIKRILIE